VGELSITLLVCHFHEAYQTRNGIPKKDQKDHMRFTETKALQTQSSALLKTCDPVKSVAGIFKHTKEANFTLSS
jgi:hypothetical protein